MAPGVVVLGTGGHAKVVIDVLTLMGMEVIGAAGRDQTATSADLGAPLIGGDDAVSLMDPSEVMLANGVGSTGKAQKRRDLFESYRLLGFSFVTLRHPWSVVGGTVGLGEGVQIMAGVVVQPGSSIAENTIINTRVSVDHDCQVGPHVHLAPGVTLSGGVRVDEAAHIGIGASVLQGVRIGARSIVGAGAAVVHDVPPDTTVVGVPALPREPRAVAQREGREGYP